MRTNFKTKLLFFCIVAVVLNTKLQAQVTIGSDEKPNKGALLDLKQENKAGVNAKRGLGMPRVNLKDKNKLYPMFSAGYDPVEDKKHTGLIVYNLTDDATFRFVRDCMYGMRRHG